VNDIQRNLDLLACPRCSQRLSLETRLRCTGCRSEFEIEDDIPLLFWPNEWEEGGRDVTNQVREFYEATPFPDYDEFDSRASLAQKARQGVFARLLDEQLPTGIRVIECGCGTGQLSSFLSLANRSVFATDMSVSSLRLGQRFAREHSLDRVRFVQMNLFRPAFRPGAFQLVISNGVLHHTSDPFLAFRSISRLIAPGGYILVGLYHRYGRLITNARRLMMRLSGDRWTSLDPNLRRKDTSPEKRRAWFVDQYKHPHETRHTIGEAMRWVRETGLELVRTIPSTRPGGGSLESVALFEPESPGNAIERLVAELGMIGSGSREGGFFVAVARRAAL